MVRDGMVDLIAQLRLMVADTDATTWTDAQLQDVLDQYKTRIYREPLECEVTRLSSTEYEYRVYHSRYRNLEAGGTAYLRIEDSAGNVRDADEYTVDAIRGVITMSADQGGTALYLTGWSYDLHRAAADLWCLKAGDTAAYYSFNVDGHEMRRSDWFEHCMKMAQLHLSQSQAETVRSWRVGADNE